MFVPLLKQAQEKIGELSEMRQEVDITKEMLDAAEQVSHSSRTSSHSISRGFMLSCS